MTAKFKAGTAEARRAIHKRVDLLTNAAVALYASNLISLAQCDAIISTLNERAEQQLTPFILETQVKPCHYNR